MPADRNSSRSGGASRGRSNSGSSRGSSSRPSSRGSSSGRPGAAKKSSSSRSASGRPSSGRPSSQRPSSGRTVTGRDASDRRGPAKQSSSRPTTASSRSESGRPSSGRPSSGRPSSGRPSSGRPSSSRPTSERTRSDRAGSDRPRSDRPRRDDERRPSTRSSDGRPKRYSDDKPKSATGNKRREWSSERPKASDDRRPSSSRPSSVRPTSGRPTSDRARTDRPSAGRPRRDGQERPRFDRKTSDRPRRDDDRGRRDDRPRGGRADRAGGRFSDRDREERPARYVSEKRVNVNDPIIPDHITGEELPRAVRNELRTLPDGLALRVARHLAASGEMINVDPELAWKHARAALNKASRVGIVREAAAEAAYNAGHFAEALTEFRAARRMRGIKEYWPLMADCERALGRPAKAISMAADPLVNSLDRASKVEMRIVASGARVDQGKLEAALATLQCPELTTTSNEAWSARIRYAYADVLEKLGRKDEALEWFHRAAAADAAEQTDADERIAALEGVVYQDAAQFDDEDFDEEGNYLEDE